MKTKWIVVDKKIKMIIGSRFVFLIPMIHVQSTHFLASGIIVFRGNDGWALDICKNLWIQKIVGLKSQSDKRFIYVINPEIHAYYIS
jgi:hypothetical protein